MSRGTAEALLDALGHFDLMQAHAGHDLADQLVIVAICMRLSAGIVAGIRGYLDAESTG